MLFCDAVVIQSRAYTVAANMTLVNDQSSQLVFILLGLYLISNIDSGLRVVANVGKLSISKRWFFIARY